MDSGVPGEQAVNPCGMLVDIDGICGIHCVHFLFITCDRKIIMAFDDSHIFVINVNLLSIWLFGKLFHQQCGLRFVS